MTETIIFILAVWLGVSLWANIKQHRALVKCVNLIKSYQEERDQ